VKGLGPKVVLALAAAFALAEAVPYLWMLSGSLKSLDEIAQVPPTLLPAQAHFDNYTAVFSAAPMGRWLLNTVVVALGIVACQLPLVVLAAYALTFLRAPARRGVQSLILACLLVPPQVRFVPVFLMLGKAGLLDSFFALIAPPDPSGASAGQCSSFRRSVRSILGMAWQQPM